MIKLIAVTGPTASGKTALAVSLAKRFDGEVVGADSMQIYREMSVATAKPTEEEMQGIRHFMIDFLEFSAADYVKLAKSAINDISSRGKLPIICGGTGLYIDSLLNNISFSEAEVDSDLRRELQSLADEKGGAYLLEMLKSFDPETAKRLHEKNLKRIIRAIEIYKTSGITVSEQNRLSKIAGSEYKYLKFFINFSDREKLYQRIDKRVDIMLENGLLDEAERILCNKDLKTSRQAIGYKELEPYFKGEKPLLECVENLKRSTRRYAKRQITWFKRDTEAVNLCPDLYGSFDEMADAAAYRVEKFLKGD